MPDSNLVQKLDLTSRFNHRSCRTPTNRSTATSKIIKQSTAAMSSETAKRPSQKREEYKKTLSSEEQNAALPKKKFFRQRAHANPFSDHALT